MNLRAPGHCALAAALMLLSGGACADAPRVELYTPSGIPDAKECAAIARHNAERQRTILEQHQACLKDMPSDEQAVRGSLVCSKTACLDLHEAMVWIGKKNNEINGQCSRTARDAEKARSEADQERRKRDALDLVERVSELSETAENATLIQTMFDRPWEIAERAWGEAADTIRQRVADQVAPDLDRNSADWQIYDLIFNKAYESSDRLHANNPVARIVNQAMLSRLYVTHAQLVSDFNRSMAKIDQITGSLPASFQRPPTSVPYASRSPTDAPVGMESAPIESGATGCAVFNDYAQSERLMKQDRARWEQLNAVCNK